jgi:hypothetical protein
MLAARARVLAIGGYIGTYDKANAQLCKLYRLFSSNRVSAELWYGIAARQRDYL